MDARVISILAIILIQVLGEELRVNATNDRRNPSEITKPLQLNPLENLIFNQSRHNVSSYSKDSLRNTLSRIKRQYGYGYGYGRDRYYPIPIIVGGIGYPAFGGRGFGLGGYGGRGFGGRGFGGRGFGGRGFGGRGFGGRGFGGRGIGGRGIGGRGGVGGGRGGRG